MNEQPPGSVAEVKPMPLVSPLGPSGPVAPAGDLAAPLPATAWRYLAATTASAYGDWLTTVGLTVLLFRLTGSAAAPAAFMVARVAPRLAGPAAGGMLADRYRPTTVIAITSVAQGMVIGLVTILGYLRQPLPIFALVAVGQFLGSMLGPCYGATIPRLVAPGQRPRMNALVSTAFSTSIFVAPALGALLLAVVSVEVLLLVDIASFAFAAVLMATLSPVAQIPASSELSSRRGARAAVSVVWRDPVLRPLVWAYYVKGAAVTAAQAVLVVAATERFGGAGNVGWLYAGVGAGAVAGGLVALRLSPAHPGRMVFLGGASLELLSLAALAVAPVLVVAALTLAATGLIGAAYETWGETALQSRVELRLLGRASSVIYFATYAGMVTGGLAALALAELVNWAVTLPLVCGAGLVVLWTSTIPMRRTAPT